MVSENAVYTIQEKVNGAQKVVLKGKVNFLFGKKITSGFDSSASKIKLPGTWRGRYYQPSQLPSKGFGTVQFTLINKHRQSNLGIRFEDVNYHATYWINGNPVNAKGYYATNTVHGRSKNLPVVFPLPATDTIQVNILLSSYHHRMGGGLLSKPVIGNVKVLQNELKQSFFIDFLRIIIVFFISIVSLITYIFFYRKKAFLFFGLMCFSALLRQTTLGNCIISAVLEIDDVAIIQKLRYIGFYGGIAFGTLYFHSIYKILDKTVMKCIVWVSAFYVLLTLSITTYQATYMVFPYQIFGLLSIFYVIISIVLAYKKLSVYGKYTALSVVLYLGVVSIDILSSQFLLDFRLMSPYGFMLMALLQIIVLLLYSKKQNEENSQLISELDFKKSGINFLEMRNKHLVKEKVDVVNELIDLINSRQIASLDEFKTVINSQKNNILIEEKIENSKPELTNQNLEIIKKIKARFPQLTKNDLEICLLIKLNYSTKEIAVKRHSTLSSIKVAKHRIRKKTNLDDLEELKYMF